MSKHDPALRLAAFSQGKGRAGPCNALHSPLNQFGISEHVPTGTNLSHPSLVVGDDGHFTGLFSNPAAMRTLPGPVNRSLPARSIMYPSLINRALCSVGIAAGEPFTAVLPTVRKGGEFVLAETL
jgi:hypothetical protein